MEMKQSKNNFMETIYQLYLTAGDLEDDDECLNAVYNHLCVYPKKASSIISEEERMKQTILLHTLLKRDSFLLVKEKLSRIYRALLSLGQWELSTYANVTLDKHEEVFRCFILEKIIVVLEQGFSEKWNKPNLFQDFLTDFSSFVCDTYTGKNIIDNPIYHLIYPDIISFFIAFDYESYFEREHLKRKALSLLTKDTLPDFKKFFHSVHTLPNKEYFCYSFQEVRNIFLPKIRRLQAKPKPDSQITRKKAIPDNEFEYFGSLF